MKIKNIVLDLRINNQTVKHVIKIPYKFLILFFQMACMKNNY